jgi:hypothetical protein
VTIYGWDMSHYDAPSIGNAVSQGISFITHKIGGDATDQEADDWWANVRSLPSSVVLGGYQVLLPGSPQAKADAFLARCDVALPGWRNRDAFIFQLDAEKWNGDSDTIPSIAECNAFCDRLVAKTNGKYMPMGYLPHWVYPSVAGFRYPVWASNYVSGSGAFKRLYPGDNSSRWASYGKPISILQYSSSATIGGQTTCDANAFRGTVDQLRALVTPGAQLDNEPQEDDMPYTEAQMKAFAWQFSGNPFPAAMSAAAVQAEILANGRKAVLQLAAIQAAVSSDGDTDAILAAVNARAAELEAAVADVDDQVWAKVPDPEVPASEKAALLRAVLGADAAEVGAILAAG